MNLKNKEKTLLLLFMTGLAFVATLPYFNTYLVNGHDLVYHLARIEGMYHSMVTGHWLVRINPIQTSGFGYASGILYPQLFLYIPAFLRFTGLSLMNCYKIFTYVINFATVGIAYFSIKGITNRRLSGIIGASLYTMSLYRLNNLYGRAATGEVLAMVFLPLLIYGLYEVICGDYKKWIWLALGYTGVIQSHILSAVMIFFFCVIIGLISFGGLLKEKYRLAALGIAAVCTVFLNLWFIIPFVEYSLLDLNVYSNAETVLWNTATSLSQVFSNNIPVNLGMDKGIETTQGEMIQSIGNIFLVTSALFIIRPTRHGEAESEGRYHKLLFLLGVCALWMATIWFPWKGIQEIPVIGGVVSVIQFTWRFLGYATLFLSISGAIAVTKWLDYAMSFIKWEDCTAYKNVQIFASVLMVAIIINSASYFLDSTTQMSELSVVQDVTSIGLGGSDQLYLYSGDYISDLERRPSDFVMSEDTIMTVNKYERYGCRMLVNMSVEETSEKGYVEIPLYYYPNYRAWMNGKEVLLTRGTNGVIRVPVDTVGTYHMEVDFVESSMWLFFDVVSVATVVALVIWFWHTRYKYKHLASERLLYKFLSL